MELFPYERRQLDRMEGDLRAEAPRLAAKFDVFTQLARGEGKPPTEERFTTEGPRQELALALQRGRQRVILSTAAIMAALIAVIVFSIV